MWRTVRSRGSIGEAGLGGGEDLEVAVGVEEVGGCDALRRDTGEADGPAGVDAGRRPTRRSPPSPSGCSLRRRRLRVLSSNEVWLLVDARLASLVSGRRASSTWTPRRRSRPSLAQSDRDECRRWMISDGSDCVCRLARTHVPGGCGGAAAA